MKKFLKDFNKHYLIIFLVALILFASYGRGYDMRHDAVFHFANLMGFISNFEIFNISKIVDVVANGFGYGTGIFYPPLAHHAIVYIYEILNIFNLNIFAAVKLGYFLSFLLSGIFMYIFVKETFNNKNAALLSAIFYMFFPYHVLDIFFRDAMSESFIFIFIPLIFLGIHYLFNDDKKKFLLCFVIGYTGAILSHLVLSIYLTFFVILFLLFNFKKVFTKKNILNFCIAALLILIFVSPFIVPLAQHMLKGDYMVFYPNHMFNKWSVDSTAVTLKTITEIPESGNYIASYIYFTVDFVALFCFICVLVNFKKIKEKRVVLSFIILTFICAFMLSPLFPWDKMPSFLLNIQFVWRIFTFLAFFMCVVAGLVILQFKNNQKIIITLLAFLTIFFSIYMVNTKNFTSISLDSYDLSTLGLGWQKEYLPRKAYNNYDYFQERDNDIIFLEGEGKVKNVKNNVPNLSFDIKTKGATIELPRLYYFGYNITLDEKEIDYKESKNGFIQIEVPSSGMVEITYPGTKLYQICRIVCLITIIVFIAYLMNLHKKLFRRRLHNEKNN